MAHILVVDDEADLLDVVSRLLRDRGHSVDKVTSGESAIDVAKRKLPDLVVLDISLPGIDGLETFAALHRLEPAPVCVFLTAHGTIRSAVRAIQAGAFDYVTKPFDNQELLLAVDRGLEARRLTEEVRRLREDLTTRQVFPGIVGASRAIQDLLRFMAKAASSDATVLILGESGTGKELVARSLHRQSRRTAGPFVAVNCSAIPSGLVESEFFGHERGSFTDAKDLRIGRFEQASSGTIFLDEVGDLAPDAQAKLLRVLQDHEVTRVGARKAISVDVRVIAATNKDLDRALARGQFRQDLYWRLNVLPVSLAPLRDRHEDVPVLIDHFLDRLNGELGLTVTGLSHEARQLMQVYDWPGNVRELENALSHAMVLTDGAVVQAGDLPPRLRPGSRHCGAVDAVDQQATLAEAVSRATRKVERVLIETTLVRCRGNRTATAEALGINRKTLFNKMRSYGLTELDEDDTDAVEQA